MSIIVPFGKLTAQVIAELEKFFDKTGPTEEIRWGLFSEDDMKDFGDVRKADCQEVLTLINLQLAETKAYIGGEKPTRELCPYPDLLKLMIEKKASIRNLANLEYKIDEIRKDFTKYDLVKVVEVVNWCRHFFTDPTMGVFYPLNADVTVGGTITPGDSHGSTTTNAGASNMPPAHAAAMRRVANMPKPKAPTPPTPPKRPTPPSSATDSSTSTSGDLVGRIHAEDGVIITIGGKPYDSKNSAHRKLAEQNGYNPNTGVEI